MKRSPISRFSEKRIAELQAEAPIRIELCKRAGGSPATREIQIYSKGQHYTYTKVECVGGTCECERPNCPKHPLYYQHLEPHHKKHSSLGGQFTTENIILVTRQCHRILQKNEPMWSRND